MVYLVDTSNTQNFIHVRVAKQARLQTIKQGSSKVKVANEDKVFNGGCAKMKRYISRALLSSWICMY